MKYFSYSILCVAVIIFLLSVFALISKGKVVDTIVFPAKLNVSSTTVGFDINITALTFGKVNQGGSATRNVIFYNDYNSPVKLNIQSEGTISPLLTYEKEVFAEINESIKIPFKVDVQQSTPQGMYYGNVTFTIISS